MKQNNKTCIACGKQYTYCNRCDDYAHLPKWMTMWCSERCKDIFNIASYFLNKELTADAANERLEQYNLKNDESFSHGVQKALDQLNHAEYLTDKNAPMVEEEVFAEEEPVKIQVRPRKRKVDSEQ